MIGGELIEGENSNASFLHPTIMENVDSSMMLYYKTLTNASFPVLCLNKFKDLQDVETQLKSSDAKIAGKGYLDQMVLITEDRSIIPEIQNRVSILLPKLTSLTISLAPQGFSITARSRRKSTRERS